MNRRPGWTLSVLRSSIDSFAGSSKAVALEMLDDIEAAFENNLPHLAWMDDTTRKRAIENIAPDQRLDEGEMAHGPIIIGTWSVPVRFGHVPARFDRLGAPNRSRITRWVL